MQMIAQSIAEAGGKVSFVAPLAEPQWREPHHPNLTRVFLSRELVNKGNRLQRKVASLRRIFGGLRAAFRQRLQTRTFFISHPERFIVSLPMFTLLRLSRARIIHFVHDPLPHAWQFGRALRLLERGAYGMSYRLSSAIVVLTPNVRDALVNRFGIDPCKITIIPHGPLALGKLPPPPGSGRLFLFGSLRRNKCVLETIQAVILARRSDPGLTLVLAGEPHEHEQDYWAECRAAMVQDPAGFDLREGFVPDDELPAIIATVDAFVLAYRDFESQSGVGVLASLSARPVLCTSSGGLAELIALGMCHEPIATPVSSEAITAAISSFRARPFSEWIDCAAKAAEEVGQTMSWQAIGQAYVQLIRRISSAGSHASSLRLEAPFT